ncbi:MAG: UvrD-helicase domain-containing protein [SAR324 cluster bacterium]|nr:UvrD-helicase domain-containing protein [SAR324 cluster bacterium]
MTTDLKKFEIFGHALEKETTFITANAGTGKTFTIVWYLIRLILEKKAAPSEIILLTYTEKAAHEFNSRLHNLANKIIAAFAQNTLPADDFFDEENNYLASIDANAIQELTKIHHATIGTIHGVILRALEFDPLNSNFFHQGGWQGTIDNVLLPAIHDVWRKYNKKLYINHLPTPEELKKIFIAQYSYPNITRDPDIKDESKLIDIAHNNPDELSDYLTSLMIFEIGKKYQYLKNDRNFHDFNDLTENMLALLQDKTQHNLFLNKFSQRYKALLVDESQDIDKTQGLLFKRLFDEQEDKYLFFVGDPKQAIYAFRGADLDEYLSWQKNVPKNNQFKLSINYRSSISLTKAINHIFGSADNPFIDERISYFDSASPLAKNDSSPTNELKKLNNPLSPVEFVNLQFINNKKPNKTVINQNIHIILANKISQLLTDKDLTIDGNPIKAGDIAILVARNDQASQVFNDLTKKGFPVLLEKSTTSTELHSSLPYYNIVNLINLLEEKNTDELSLLNSFLASHLVGLDANRALAISTDYQTNPEDRLLHQNIILLLNKARSIFHKNGFCKSLFYLLNHETIINLSETFTINQHYLSDKVYLIQLTKIIKAAEEFEIASGHKNLAHALSTKKINFISLLDSDESNTKSDQISIMTYHKAKGLEFPIVITPFLWDQKLSFTKNDIDIYKKDTRWVLNLTTKKDIKPNFAEQKRIIYIALTRAKSMLIILIPDYLPRSKIKQFSSLDLLLSNEQVVERGDIFKFITALCKDRPTLFREQTFTEIEIEKISLSLKNYSAKQVDSSPSDTADVGDGNGDDINYYLSQFTSKIPHLTKKINQSYPAIASYSRIVAGMEKNIAHLSQENRDYDKLIEQKISETPGSSAQLEPSVDFPHSNISGIFFHELLAKWNYQGLAPKDFDDYMDISVRLNNYFPFIGKSQQDNLARAAKNCLTKLAEISFIPEDKPRFQLSNLNQGNSLAEWDFFTPYNFDWKSFYNQLESKYYPIKKDYEQLNRPDRLAKDSQSDIFSSPSTPNNLTGSIDLLLKTDDYYYIIDWKINYLPSYLEEDLAKDFLKNRYFVQTIIYSFGVKTYLEKMMRQDPTKKFGGCFYVYLRGVLNGQGIYYIPPSHILDKLTQLK